MRWLHVHPDYIVSDGEWALIRLAAEWRESLLPDPGGVQQQASFTVAAIRIIHDAWAKLEAARAAKNKNT